MSIRNVLKILVVIFVVLPMFYGVAEGQEEVCLNDLLATKYLEEFNNFHNAESFQEQYLAAQNMFTNGILAPDCGRALFQSTSYMMFHNIILRDYIVSTDVDPGLMPYSFLLRIDGIIMQSHLDRLCSLADCSRDSL